MPAPIKNILLFFILSFLFILEVGPSVCHTIHQTILAYPCIEHWSNIQSHYLAHDPTRVFYTMPFFGKI
jgi:hypothetical protein